MGILSELDSLLEKIPLWKRLKTVPDEEDRLKQQVAELEAYIKSSGGEKGLKTQPSSALRKGIRSLEKRIAEHEAKINAPEKYCDEWATYSKNERIGMVNHWKKENKDFQQSIYNRLEELRNRGEDYNE